MLLEIIWDREITSVDLLDGTIHVGGSPSDEIRLPGLPHGLLRLSIEGERVTVTSIRSVRIGGALFPARVPRLLVPGEDLKLPNDVVLRRAVDVQRRDARKAAETAVVVKELLAGELAPDQTRAAILTCLTGGDQGAVFPLAFTESVLGRGDDADVRIRDRAVSRRHASLRRHQDRYLLRDLCATNGVFLNGTRVKGSRPLKSGDIIELGLTMLRFDGPERSPEELPKVGAPRPPSPDGLVPADGPTAEVPQPSEGPSSTPAPSETPEPVAAPAPKPEGAPAAPLRGTRWDVALVGVGALLAVTGTVLTVLLMR